MRRLFVLLICLLASGAFLAQKYGNEWINYSQQYFKIAVKKEGIYRIDSTTLSQYFNLSVINPKNFQLFIKGAEQRLYIFGEGDGKINTGDYVEFYSDGLVGDVDSLIYTNIKYLPNRYTPLFNDSLFAFLTLNGSVTNKRYTFESDISFSSYPQGQYYYSENIYAGSGAYNHVPSVNYSENGSNPLYTQAEAKGLLIYDLGPPYVYSTNTTIPNFNPYTANPSLPVYFTYNLSGYGISNQSPDHRYQLYFNTGTLNPLMVRDSSFSGFLPIRETLTLNPQNLGPTFTYSIVPTQLAATSSDENRIFFHYAQLFYPHSLNLGNDSIVKMRFDNSGSATKSTYSLSNFFAGNSSAVSMLDLSNGVKLSPVLSGNNLGVVVPNGAGRKLCYLASGNSIVKVTALQKVNGSGYFTNFRNKTFTKPYVIVYNNQLKSSALNYASFRNSPTGGYYNVIAADASELYLQFIYGANQHPMGIKNFIRYLNDSLSAAPRYVLLIGHGIHAEEANYNGYNYTGNLIPAMGVPASDYLYTAALSDTSNYIPQIPIGRLPMLNNTEVENYLAKMKQHVSPTDSAWKKNVLHFVGGDDDNLSKTLYNYTKDYATIISDTLYGATVTTFTKNTSAPIQTNINDSIFGYINNGCSILTFFGHGSLTGFDQAIDDPSKYKNTGRYPLIVANSCNSGDFNYSDPRYRSVSENFVIAHQKGGLGFIATTTFGQDNMLYQYTLRLMRALAVTKYNQGVGDAIKEAIYQSCMSTEAIRLVSLDMSYAGDPAFVIAPGSKPDYEINNSSISFNLQKNLDSLGINIHITNTGAAPSGTLTVKIVRQFPNGDSVVIYKDIHPPLSQYDLNFSVLRDMNRGIGLNRFSVKVDYFNSFNEKLESNNSTLGTVDVIIPGNDIYPVFPYKYAIVPKTASITLKASTSDPFAPAANYIFQLDTCDKFTNAVRSTTINSKGGVVEWNVDLPFADSTVYYWRVSRDSTGPQSGFTWKEFSFQTIGIKRGWSQAHFDQFKLNQYQYVTYKKSTRLFEFQNSYQYITCRTGRLYDIQLAGINYFFNSIRMLEGSCQFGGWNIAVFDSISGAPVRYNYPNAPTFGPDSGGVCNYPAASLSFGEFMYNNSGGVSVPNWRKNLENFINHIPQNQYVLLYGVGFSWNGYAHASTLGNPLYTAFESLGSGIIRNLPDTVPYILFGRKGLSVGQAHELTAKRASAIITLEDSIHTTWHDGHIASEKIGPARNWNSLHWRMKSLDNQAGDNTVLKVVGFDRDGKPDTLATFPQDSADVFDLARYTRGFPYIQLVALMSDKTFNTSPQLKRWQVIYEEVPELAINPKKGFETINDTLQEGDNVYFHFPIENISVKDFADSLAISYWVEDNKRNKVPLTDRYKLGGFTAGQMFIDTLKVNSYQLKGNNAVWIDVNPIGHRKNQSEQYHFNNSARYPFKVNGDITNPLLDVTFDGIRILNGDIVSSRPNIFITLKDENKFLALDNASDTSAFSIFLQAPTGGQLKPVYFAQGLIFTPASLPKNSCSIQYNPVLETDGRYTLVIQAKDRSNNLSGKQDYRIQFEVNNKPSISEVMNYPNPFSTSTRFVFTLTGYEVPEVFTIQIMTISGKVVREITRGELGYIHIGRNMTEFSWDGRDQFGDRLGNGVYLYRVITRLNGEKIDKYESGADRFFTKGYGKMVIMR